MRSGLFEQTKDSTNESLPEQSSGSPNKTMKLTVACGARNFAARRNPITSWAQCRA